MKNNSIYVGVDLGGTWIRLLGGRGDSGEIFEKKKYPSPFRKEGDRSLLEDLYEGLSFPDRPGHYLEEKILEFLKTVGNPTLLGIGISAPGRITGEKNFIGANTDIRFAREEPSGERGIDLTSSLKRRFPGIPIEMENDATATGHFCAHHFNYHRGIPLASTFYVTVSTGIGGGGIFDYPYEVGHMRSAEGFPPFIPLCGCGLEGCLEAYGSGISLEKRGVVLLEAFFETPELFGDFEMYESLRMGRKVSLQKGIQESGLSDRYKEEKEKGKTLVLSTGHIFEVAQRDRGEEISSLESYLVWDSGLRIAQALASLAHLFGLKIICLGGGVIEKNEFFLRRIEELFQSFVRASQIFQGKIEILPPPLREEASDYGALALVKKMEF